MGDFDTLDVSPTIPGDDGGDKLLAGRYRVIRKLGEGGMGLVYLAEDTELSNNKVAIKFIPPQLAGNVRAIKNLKKEAHTSMQLSHPNIVRLHDLHTDGHQKFLVMECIDGKTLEDALAEKDEDKFTLEEVLPIAEQIAAGLDYAHSRKVLHRDLKPSNIMIAKDDTVKLLDFGIAREMKDSYTRVTGHETSGTLPYMSPQQLMGEPPTVSMDIYSFAAVIYECLCGHPPFYMGDVREQIKTKIPAELIGISSTANNTILSALAKNSNQRPKKAPDLIAMLKGRKKIHACKDTLDYSKTISIKTEKSKTRWKKVLAVVAVCVLVIVAALVFYPVKDVARNYFATSKTSDLDVDNTILKKHETASEQQQPADEVVESEQSSDTHIVIEKSVEQIESEVLAKKDKDAIKELDKYLNFLLQDKKYEKAIEEAGKYLDTKSAPIAYCRIAEAKLKMSDEQAATQFFHKAIDKAVADSELTAQILFKMEGLLGEEQVLTYCQEVDAESSSLLANWANFLTNKSTGQYNQGLQDIDKCIEIIGTDNLFQVNYKIKKIQLLALAYKATSDTDYLNKALANCETLLAEASNRNNASMLNNLAFTLADVGIGLSKALEYAEHAHGTKPDSPFILDTYAYVLYKNGRYSDADKFLQRALEQCKKSNVSPTPELYEHLGMIKESLGDKIQAIVAYKKALEVGADRIPKTVKERITSALGRLSGMERLQWFLKAAEEGSAEAMVSIGTAYYKGEIVARDYAKALEWFNKAVEADSAKAMGWFGRMYHRGEGVEQDYAKAIQWFRKAEEKGSSEATVALGAIYYKGGGGIEKNYTKALDYFNKGAEAGLPKAMVWLGNMYSKGDGIPQDYEKAAQWFLKAANKGYSDAMVSLGAMYVSRPGTTRDAQKALEWFNKAVELDNSNAMTWIGTMYFKGTGVAQDYKKAIEWIRRAANAGNVPAMSNLGTMYLKGQGVAKDPQRALVWLNKAAEAGYHTAMIVLGNMYITGEGFTKDHEKAINLFSKAAAAGNPDAMEQMGQVYESGLGVSKDYKQAIHWYKKAAQLGHKRSQTRLTSIGVKWQ